MSKYISSIIVALLCSITFTIYIPLVSYQNNINEFSFTGSALIMSLVPYFFGIFICVMPLLLLSNKFFAKHTLHIAKRVAGDVSLFHVIVTAIVFCTWLEGSLLSYNLPKLTGEANLFPSASPRFALDSIIWLSILLLSILFRGRILPKLLPIVLSLSLLLVLGIADSTMNSATRTIPTITRSQVLDRASFSSDSNVLVMVLDATSTALIKDYLELYPERKNDFAGFLVFQNNMETTTNTQWALPSILKGNIYTGGPVLQYQQSAFDADISMAAIFAREGYNTYASSILPMFNNIKQNEQSSDWRATSSLSMTSQLYGQLYIRFSPYMFKNAIANNVGYQTAVNKKDMLPDGNLSTLKNPSTSGDELTYETLMHAITVKNSTKPTFHFHHVNGSHKPYTTDRAGNELPQTERYSIKGLQEQSIWTFNNVVNLLQCMKENGIYDSATIVFLGDHDDRMTTNKNRSNIEYSKQPVLMIKPAKQAGEPVFALAPTSNMYLAGILPKLHLKNEPLDKLTRNLPATRSIFFPNESVTIVYKGEDIRKLSPIEKRPVIQEFAPSTLKPDIEYSLSMLGSNPLIAYPLSYENADFANGWGLKFVAPNGSVHFSVQDKKAYNIIINVETSFEGGGHGTFEPYTVTLLDKNSSNAYTLDIKKSFQQFTLNAVQISDTNTLDLSFSLSKYNPKLQVFIQNIKLTAAK